jgi:Malectin domain
MSNGSVSLAGDTGVQPHPDLVRAELDRLLQCDHFKNSRRCRTLLSYLVEETIAGRGDQLKERLVGINVFGRNPDYETAEDPVVRNAAIEVRKRLAQFYIESGNGTQLRIDLHPGTYVPEFRCAVENRMSGQPRERLLGRIGRRPAMFAIVAVVLLLSIMLAVLVYRYAVPGTVRIEHPQSPSTHPAGTAASSTLPATAAEDGAVRILAGNLQSGPYVDRFGDRWSPDCYFTGGLAKNGPTNFFFPPADPGLFRTMRRGTFAYDIPLEENQVYEMRLYFVETQIHYGSEVGGDGENLRLFQVRANGQVILDNFDVTADGGFASTTTRAFRNIVAAQDGKLHLQFTAVKSEPLVSAIELLPSTASAIPPIRIHAAPLYAIDHAGNHWSPDDFYIGGELYDANVPITETTDADLFKVERLGNFHYAIPVPPGHYSLTLYFAETWFHDPGKRVFDVSCNGVMLLHRFDIFKQAGFAHVYQKTFHGLEPNGQGKLFISFSPVVNYASVRALEVIDEGR